MTEALSSPVRDGPLVAVNLGRFVVHACPETGGVWMGNDAAQLLVRTPMKPEELERLRNAEAAATDPPVPQRPRQLGCPVCKKPLATTVWKLEPGDHDAFGIELDVCGAHGTWFDRGEVERLIRMRQQQYEVRAEPSAAEVADFQWDLAPAAFTGWTSGNILVDFLARHWHSKLR